MKNILFIILIVGVLLMCASLLLINIYLLAIAEIITLITTILLVRLNLKRV